MRSVLKIGIALLSLCGASFAQAQDEFPTCSDQKQCEIMWSKAAETVGLVSNLRVRLATDTRIETFGPARPDHVAVLVTKVPVNRTDYQIRVQVDCFPSDYCASMQRDIRKVFIAQMESVR